MSYINPLSNTIMLPTILGCLYFITIILVLYAVKSGSIKLLKALRISVYYLAVISCTVLAGLVVATVVASFIER